jgi:hypothetical protein
MGRSRGQVQSKTNYRFSIDDACDQYQRSGDPQLFPTKNYGLVQKTHFKKKRRGDLQKSPQMQPRRKKKTMSVKGIIDNDTTNGGEKVIQTNGIYRVINKKPNQEC